MAAERIKNPELSHVRNTVVFVFNDSSEPCGRPETTMPIGTGFMIGIESVKQPGSFYKFVITNAHVIQGQSVIKLRLNDKSGTKFVCYSVNLKDNGLDKNVFKPAKPYVDLVAISIPDIPDTDPAFFDFSMILDRSRMASLEIEEGTEVVSVGFLAPYSGLTKNFPVMRFGKIALLTEENWSKSERGFVEQGYIIEIYNVGGSSGSPVVLQPSQIRVNPAGLLQQRRIAPLLIGVIKGHPCVPAPIFEKDLSDNYKKVEGKIAVVSSGVAIVEPAENLRELIELIADNIRKTGDPVKLVVQQDVPNPKLAP